jgi:hypothetical protein
MPIIPYSAKFIEVRGQFIQPRGLNLKNFNNNQYIVGVVWGYDEDIILYRPSLPQ